MTAAPPASATGLVELRDAFHECNKSCGDSARISLRPGEFVHERKPGEHVRSMEHVGAVGSSVAGIRNAGEEHPETLEATRIAPTAFQGTSTEHRHRVEPSQEQAMRGIEVAEDAHESFQGGKRFGFAEGFGQSRQAAGFRNVVEEGFDESVAPAKPIVDGDPRDPGLSGDRLEGEGVVAHEDVPGGGDDPAAGRVHPGPTLLQVVWTRAHGCI